MSPIFSCIVIENGKNISHYYVIKSILYTEFLRHFLNKCFFLNSKCNNDKYPQKSKLKIGLDFSGARNTWFSGATKVEMTSLENDINTWLLLPRIHLKVHYNPAEYCRLQSQCCLLWQTKFTWLTKLTPWELPADWSNGILHHIEPIREGVRRISLMCKFLVLHFQSFVMIG